MIVRIREKDGVRLTIPLPTGLIFNRFTASIAAKAAPESGITAEQMNLLFRAIRQYKRRHPDWVLAEVHSADGDEVYVKI